MAKYYVQVEVLLMTGTSFVAANPVIKDGNSGNPYFSEIERLQDACWNGWLQAMLPELCTKPANEGILYLWEIRENQACLELELSEVPLPVDCQKSITPRSFLPFQDFN